MKNGIVKWLVIIALAVGGWFGWGAWKKSRELPPSWTSAPVERTNLSSSVSASGTLSPVVNVSVGAQVSGRIEALFADFNDEVTQGQLLARIDQSVYRANVNQATARVQSATASMREAQANAELMEKTLNRMRQLVQQDLIARAELDTAEANYQMAQARVLSARSSLAEAQASLDNAKANLEYTEIYSPVSGVVLSREIDVGQSVQASFEAPTLFQIAEDLNRMQVNTSVAEADISRVKAGMKARFTVDAYSSRTFEGTVREVRLAATTESNVVTYDAVIDVPNEEKLLYPGMTATIDFIIDERTDTLSIPNAALRFAAPEGTVCAAENPGASGPSDAASAPSAAGRGPGAPGGRSPWRQLWIANEDGSLRCTYAKLGITDGRRTEIVEGDLKEGDLLVTSEASSNAGPRQGGPPRVF